MLEQRDLNAVKELAEHIWEGHDYLGNIAHQWIAEGGFYGLFEGSRLIGCSKLTFLPDKVIWLEGLRIHPDYQGHGLGSELSAYVMDQALLFKSEGKADSIEFSTYCLNHESIHISQKAGFRIVDEFYILTHDLVKPLSYSDKAIIDKTINKFYPSYLPYGWKFLHPCQDSLNWLQQRAKAVQCLEGSFYVGGEEPTVCLLTAAGKWLLSALPQIQFCLGDKYEANILLHTSRQEEVQTLLDLGFHWWDEGQEDKIFVFRYFADR